MKKLNIINGPQNVSAIVQGCMRISGLSKNSAADVIRSSYESGVNFYDHADIYGKGEAEVRFSEAFALSGLKREDVFIQSKCGICNDRKCKEFDWSFDYIMKSVEGILSRLKTDYLDVLLLHRPDALFDPEEVAKAFDALKTQGKVRYFGVSNTMPMQIELLKKYVNVPIIFNQLQLSVEQSQLIDQGLHLNCKNTDLAVNRDGCVLDYCRLNDITVQAWSPLQYGSFKGTFIDNSEFPKLNEVLGEIAEREKVTKAAVALAWILRHPAKMQAIIGSTNPQHIREACQAANIELTHGDWYEIYLASGKYLP